MTFFGHRFSFYASHEAKKTMPASAPTGQQQAPLLGDFFKKVRQSFAYFFSQKSANDFQHVCGRTCGLICIHGGEGPRDNPFSMEPTDRYNKAGWRNR